MLLGGGEGKEEETVLVFFEGGFGPIGGAEDDFFSIDVGPFVVEKLLSLAKKSADLVVLEKLDGFFGGAFGGEMVESNGDGDTAVFGADEGF